jgi:hypothetical protein
MLRKKRLKFFELLAYSKERYNLADVKVNNNNTMNITGIE